MTSATAKPTKKTFCCPSCRKEYPYDQRVRMPRGGLRCKTCKSAANAIIKARAAGLNPVTSGDLRKLEIASVRLARG